MYNNRGPFIGRLLATPTINVSASISASKFLTFLILSFFLQFLKNLNILTLHNCDYLRHIGTTYLMLLIFCNRAIFIAIKN